MITPRHRQAIKFYWSQYSLSDVAHLCGLTQDRVRRVWQAAIERGEIVPPGVDRPNEGWPLEIAMLGPIGNQCSPELRRAS